jgi:hypothetical protein
MRKFRKKPVVIEAERITKAMIGAQESIIGVTYEPDHLLIETLEGVMRGNIGDWLIRGVVAELYPCKDEIFQKTFEPVEYTVEDVHAETLAILANANLRDLTINDIRQRLVEKFGEVLVDAARRSITEDR